MLSVIDGFADALADRYDIEHEIGRGGMATVYRARDCFVTFITTGDPLDLRTQVVEVFIKGREVPNDDRRNRLYLKNKARAQTIAVP